MLKSFSSLILVLGSISSIAQVNYEEVLIEIRSNNKSIQAAYSYLESKTLDYKTGNTPSDPFIEADYMFGKPASGGDQFDLLVIQQFDFPSAYKHRSDLSKKRSELLRIGILEIEQSKLLSAKKICLEIVYTQKAIAEQLKRKEAIEKLLNTYQKKFELDEITAIDLNKAKLQLLRINEKLRSLKSEQHVLSRKLVELNGGKEINFTGNDYLTMDTLVFSPRIKDSIISNEPKMKWLKYQAQVLETELKLSKSLALPKFEVGYHYQTVLGQTFNGAHIGLSIPLWQQKNTVKASRSKIAYNVSQEETFKTELEFNVLELHQKFLNLTKSIDEYENLLSELNSVEILTRSLELGEIDFITYAMELDYFFKAKDDLLLLKKHQQLIYAELLKYKL